MMGTQAQDRALRIAQEERGAPEEEAFECLVRDYREKIVNDVQLAGQAIEEALACGKVDGERLGSLLLFPIGRLPLGSSLVPVEIAEEITWWYAERLAQAEQEYLAEVERRDAAPR